MSKLYHIVSVTKEDILEGFDKRELPVKITDEMMKQFVSEMADYVFGSVDYNDVFNETVDDIFRKGES